jgi:glycine/D-amino acid oxidase-like deaminating enzyme
MATTADVVVVGGGVIGASTAFQLATLGIKRVVVCERHPEVRGLFVCSGDNGGSFKTAPAVGRVLAEGIAEGRPELMGSAPFRMTRFAEGQPLYGSHEYGDRDTDDTRAQKMMLG